MIVEGLIVKLQVLTLSLSGVPSTKFYLHFCLYIGGMVGIFNYFLTVLGAVILIIIIRK